MLLFSAVAVFKAMSKVITTLLHTMVQLREVLVFWAPTVSCLGEPWQSVSRRKVSMLSLCHKLHISKKFKQEWKEFLSLLDLKQHLLFFNM